MVQRAAAGLTLRIGSDGEQQCNGPSQACRHGGSCGGGPGNRSILSWLNEYLIRQTWISGLPVAAMRDRVLLKRGRLRGEIGAIVAAAAFRASSAPAQSASDLVHIARSKAGATRGQRFERARERSVSGGGKLGPLRSTPQEFQAIARRSRSVMPGKGAGGGSNAQREWPARVDRAWFSRRGRQIRHLRAASC